MKAGAKAPWVLAAVAALLGLYIALFERKHETTDEARAARERLFADLNRGDIATIEIDRGAKGRVTLTRNSASTGGNAWRIEPGGAVATTGAVGDLLDAIDGLDVDRVATATAQEAGLETPTAHLAITTQERSSGLAVGGVDASGRGVFVSRDGGKRIFVVGVRLRELVDRDADAFRDHRLFAATSIEGATTLVFQARDGGPPQTLRKRAGVWLDEQGMFANRDGVSETLRILAALRASRFLSAPAGYAGVEKASRTIEIGVSGGERPARLEILAGDCTGQGQLAAYTPGLTGTQVAMREWMCLDTTSIDQLWRQLERANRRDLHLLVVDPAGIDGFTLAEGERKLRLHRGDDAAWRFVEPNVGYEADTKVVSDWLGELAAMTLAEGSAPARAGDAGAARRLIVEGATRAEVEIEPRRRGQSRVERAGEAAPAVVGVAGFGALDPEPLRFRSRAVLALPQFDVRGVEIRRPRSQVRLSRESGAAWLRTGDGAPPNASAVDHLLSMLSDLRAQEFVIPQPTSFRPETTVDVEVRSGDAPVERHRLEQEKCRARLEETPVFTLPQKLCEELQRTLGEIR